MEITSILGITRIISIISSNVFCREVILNISTLSYALLLLLLLVSLSRRFKLNGKIITILGAISFEIYLLHNKLIAVVPDINKYVVIAIMYFTVLIMLSYIFSRVNNKINKNLKLKINSSG